jgi:hypothetical protein
MRKILVAALAAFLTPAFAAGPSKLVDLDRPGAMESLATENPGHHRRALDLIRVAETVPCKLVPPRTIEAKMDAEKFSCAPTILMTSFPPKRRVAFTLDDTRYQTIVTITDAGARLMPAK